jgi:hypothetical protein
MDWMKIGSALLIIAMIIWIWPNAKRMMAESRKPEAGEWGGVLLPLAAVAGFVVLLIMMV